MGGDIVALSILLVITLFSFGLYLWKVKGISYDYRYLYGSTIITVIVFLYLFFISMIYWFANKKTKYYDFNELILFGQLAKSAHFAANAIINPTLYNLSGYTKEILQYIKNNCGARSFSYLTTEIALLIAPICTAAWLITLLSRGFLENLIVIFGRGKKECIVFLDVTPRSIELAKSLRKKYKKRKFIFCNSAHIGRVISREVLSSVHAIGGYFFNGPMRDLALQKNETSILFFESLENINEQDMLGAENNVGNGKVIVISNESEEYIRFVFENVVTDNKLKAISYLQSGANIILEEENKSTDTCITIADGIIVDFIKKKMNGVYQNYLLEKIQNQSEIKLVNVDNSYKHWQGTESGIEEEAIKLIDSTRGTKRLFIAYENIEKNIETKRHLLNHLQGNDDVSIFVYCNDRRIENIEKKWDERNRGNGKVEYVGRNDLIISGIAEECIEFIDYSGAGGEK